MKKYFPLVLALVLTPLAAVSGQIPAPTPADDVVKISTNLIQFDITVTDPKGRPITDLKPEEFIISENGEKQKISNFSFVAVPDPAPLTEAERKAARETARIPTGPVRAENVRRTIAIVVDDLSMSFAGIAAVRHDIRKFLDEQVQPGDLVAIIRTGKGMGALQQFTSDRRLLYAAADKIKWNAGGIGGTSPFTSIQDLQTAREKSFATAAPLGGEDRAEKEMQQFRSEIFANGTLGALNFVIKGMAELPGRKSIMLLSEGFSLQDNTQRFPMRSQTIMDGLRRLIDAANRASVVINTMDAKGVTAPGLTAEDNTFMMNDEQVSALEAQRDASTIDSREGLQILANETGGVSIIGQNDMAKGLRRVFSQQSYYLVGYEPDADTFNPKKIAFNRFEVKVTRPGARVRYRKGFFGVSQEQFARAGVVKRDSLMQALTSPFAVSDVAVRMNPLIAADEKRAAYLKTFLNIDGSAIEFVKQQDGRNQASLDIVAMTFGENGAVIDERAQNIKVTVTDKMKENLRERGIVATFTLPVKKAGGYQVRLAIRDTLTGKVGSANQFVQVPNLKKGDLTLSGVVAAAIPAVAFNPKRYGEPLSDPEYDTAVRRFPKETILRFAYDIYNAKLDAERKPALEYSYTLYKEGKPVLVTPTQPLVEPADPRGTISASGAIQLGRDLAEGDYVLEIDVFDASKPTSKKKAIQFVEFEVVAAAAEGKK